MWAELGLFTPVQWFLTALAGIGFLGLFVACLPPLLASLGLTRVRLTAQDDPAGVDAGVADVI